MIKHTPNKTSCKLNIQIYVGKRRDLKAIFKLYLKVNNDFEINFKYYILSLANIKPSVYEMFFGECFYIGIFKLPAGKVFSH